MSATMKDIAKQTGLGLATISSYFNGGNVRKKNREKIEAAIKELNFEVNEVARFLKTNRTKTIGIILPELNNIFFAEIIITVEDILRRHGYASIICDCRSDSEREKEAAEFLLHRRVDGLIILPIGSDDEVFSLFSDAEKPVVTVDRKPAYERCDCVIVDNEGAAVEAVKRLVEAGHKKIGFIEGPENIYTSSERKKGYIKGLAESKIPLEESLIERGDYTIEGGANAMHRLHINNPDMTAVFISNYEMTVGAMIDINENGLKVPEELSVIGFDNVDFARACSPKLSIITQPTDKIAQCAAEILIKRLENNDDTEVHIPYQVVVVKTGFSEGRSVKTIV